MIPRDTRFGGAVPEHGSSFSSIFTAQRGTRGRYPLQEESFEKLAFKPAKNHHPYLKVSSIPFFTKKKKPPAKITHPPSSSNWRFLADRSIRLFLEKKKNKSSEDRPLLSSLSNHAPPSFSKSHEARGTAFLQARPKNSKRV